MPISTFVLGPLNTNCYVLHDEKTAFAIDPGGPAQAVLDFLEERKLSLALILCTHLHFDHTGGIQELIGATGATVRASELDRHMLENELGRGGVWGFPLVEPYDFTPLLPGEFATPAGMCRTLPTPGHTPGGLSFYFPELASVFSGDTLFHRSIGRTDFPGGDQNTLLFSIREQLFSLPDDTTVYPGHGPATSIGEERRNNPYVSDFSAL